MSNAQNGARIKVFGGSPDASKPHWHTFDLTGSIAKAALDSTAGGGIGFVNNVTFQNFHGELWTLFSCEI